MIVTRELTFIDISIAGFAGFIGFFALNTAIGLWRVRKNNGILLTSIMFKLLAFTLWTFEIIITSLFEWRERLPVSAIVQGMTNLEHLTLAVPMGILLIWVIPLQRALPGSESKSPNGQERDDR